MDEQNNSQSEQLPTPQDKKMEPKMDTAKPVSDLPVPNQAVKKEGFFNSQTKLIALTVVITAMVLIPVVYFIASTQKQTEPEKTPDSTSPTTTVEPTSEVTPTEEISQYLTYEDGFITFEYPKEWTVDVKSGKVIEKECVPEGEGILIDGVKSISIKQGNDMELNLVYYSCPLDGGPYFFSYNPDDPKTLIDNSPEATGNIALSKAPFYQYIDQIEDYFFIFPNGVDIFGNKQFNSWGFVYEGNPNIELRIEDGGTNFVDLKKSNFIGPTDQNQVDILASVIDVKCEVSTELEADSCLDMLSHFFDTAKRVN